MRTVFYILFLSLLTNVFGADSSSAQITLRTYLEQDDVALNREVVYQVELSWEGDLQRYHILRVSEPALTNLKLRGSGSSNRFYVDENGLPRSVKKISYYFTPLDMGMAYIDGINVQYEDKNTQESQSLSAQRLGVKIVEPVDEPGLDADTGTVLIITLAILFLFVLAYFLAKYFRLRKQEQENILPQKTLEEHFLEELSTQQKAENGEAQQMFEKTTHLLKKYFSEKYQLPQNVQLVEVRPHLEQAGIDSAALDKLDEMYQRSELSKFAGEKISESEFHLFLDTAEMILNKINDLGRINES